VGCPLAPQAYSFFGAASSPAVSSPALGDDVEAGRVDVWPAGGSPAEGVVDAAAEGTLAASGVPLASSQPAIDAASARAMNSDRIDQSFDESAGAGKATEAKKTLRIESAIHAHA